MANFTGEYSIQTRRNVNKYCKERELKIFGPWEYFKSWFPKFFPEDKINKEFCKNYLFISGNKNNASVLTLEKCITNIFQISKCLIADGGYNYNNRARMAVDFRGNKESLFAYEFLSLIRTKKDRDNVYSELEKILRLMVSKTYLEAKDLFELVRLVYRVILVYEKNKNKIDDILKSARDINMRYVHDKNKIREDTESFKNSFGTLISFFKKELYPIVLKNIDSCFGNDDNENNEYKDKMLSIYHLLEITPEDIFTYERFSKEYERTKRIIEQSSQMESQENDSVKESINFLNKIFPDSNINNIFDFEFVLPYFLKNIISSDDLKLETAELASISKEDPTQIVISIFSIIWYGFLTSFEIENEQENSDIISELGVLKTRWQKYFGIFKKYFEKLLNHNKEAYNQRKDVLKDMLNEVKSQIFYINNKKDSESLSEFLKEVILFFNKLDANKIKFFIRAKLNSNERIKQEDSVNVLRNYKKLIESFGYLLVDRNSFLIRNVNEIKFPTDYEKAILVKFDLI